jgi:hypothetical protein
MALTFACGRSPHDSSNAGGTWGATISGVRVVYKTGTSEVVENFEYRRTIVMTLDSYKEATITDRVEEISGTRWYQITVTGNWDGLAALGESGRLYIRTYKQEASPEIPTQSYAWTRLDGEYDCMEFLGRDVRCFRQGTRVEISYDDLDPLRLLTGNVGGEVVTPEPRLSFGRI